MTQRETDAAVTLRTDIHANAAPPQPEEAGKAETNATLTGRTSSRAHHSSRARLAMLGMIALLPSFLKRPCYRLFFGYRVGKRVRIGLTVLDAAECEIADDVSIGHLNLVIGVKKIVIGDHVRIGHLNILRGGDEIRIGRYAEIMRMNEINSIPEPDAANPVDPRFLLGDGSIITTGHKIDFTDRVEIGRRTILGGRNSSLWTHNRQRTRPIEIGSFTYIGSEIRIAPGGSLPSRCIVGIGAVITKQLKDENYLVGGVPAKPIKPLDTEDIFLIEQRTRPDLPDDI
jgi:acetyltransferase-like isoleucine patch superfamily enzyme